MFPGALLLGPDDPTNSGIGLLYRLVRVGLAHLLEKGQETAVDPFGLHDGLEVSYLLSEHPDLLAVYEVALVVAGHVVAVVAAHDRALAVLPRSHRHAGQLAMLVLVVGYTFTGIYLLLSV